MNKYNNKLPIIISLILSFLFIEDMQGQYTIVHKSGAFYSDLMTNEYGASVQKTHLNRYTIYTLPSSTVTLTVPPESGGVAAPHAYYRWYNYATDGLPANVTPKVDYINGTNGKYILNNSTLNAQQADYSFNAGGAAVIACDVSAYKDFTYNNNNLTEPTLSYRCIFDIRDAKEIADKLANLASDKYLEENTVYVPSVKMGTENPRVCLQYERNNYFGYTTAGKTTVANGTFTITGTSSNSGRLLYIEPKAEGTTQEVTVTMTCGTQTYRIARFKIIFENKLPMKYDDLKGTNRSVSYLDSNYVLLTKLDFDYDTAPATESNNMWAKPLSWDICSYGFASRGLYLAGYRTAPDLCTADWNEYGFYKTTNVFTNGYKWWNQAGQKVYDRRYYDSNKSENGYFFYVDASNKPGTVAKLQLQDKLCPGTKLFVSAGICNMTRVYSDADVNFIFKGVDANGAETELHRFTSGDIPKTTASEAEWYQTYYSFSYNTNIDYDHYILQIDNNASSTQGGDYAIDDIRIYRSKPAVQANQVTLPCGSESSKVKIRVEYEKLLSALNKTESAAGSGEEIVVKYKFLDNSKNSIAYNYNTDSDPDTNYGSVRISTDFTAMKAMTSSTEAPYTYSKNPVLAFTETEVIDGTTYRYITFQTPNNNVLKENKTYYSAIASSSGTFGTGICDMISDPFTIIPPAIVTVDGVEWNEGDGICYGHDLVISAKLKDRITHENITCRFDWYMGTKEDFETIPTGGMSVNSALTKYREVYPNPASSDTSLSPVAGNFTQDAYNILQNLMNNNKLILNKKEITRLIKGGEYLLAVPILATAEVTSATTTLVLCNENIPIKTGNVPKNPTIALSGEGYYNLLSVRMGLKQFNDLKNNSAKTLKVPVIDFRNEDQTKKRDLIKVTDTNVYLIGTDDPSIQNVDSLNPSIQVAKLDTIHVTSDINDVDFLALKIPANSIAVKEGYTYKLEFHFNQKLLAGDQVACDGVIDFYLKIVPEYLTWTGSNGDNWNNDSNWKRSLKAELYKGNTDSYADDTNSHGFVPMNFTKVTIANTKKAPWLYKLTGSPYPFLENTNYADSISKKENTATASIEYSMMVKANGDNYDCENFYANTCNQIYFKPLAEMRNTNYLSYNKAWIDFELISGRWYMLASPLKGVVAGDMYLPTATGRQETEAFKPITYSTSTNNRFNPAVYQRSWDHSISTVFKNDGSSFDSYISANWSQVYNKVDEGYTSGKGFSIRPVYGTEGTDKVLFRLPKDDISYSYYSYDGTASGNNTSITRTDNGRLSFENNASDISLTLANATGSNNIYLVGNPFVATLDMKKFFDAHPKFERRFWILTGTGQSAVAIAEDGTLTTSGSETLTGSVAPMQSFFIEKKSSVTENPTVTFTSDMTIAKPATSIMVRSGNSNVTQTDNSSVLRITAERNGNTSNILIKKEDNASNDYDAKEDVPVLIDSNLADNPTLYSMAGNQAAMINVISSLKTIPLGVYSENNENVTLTFKGITNLGQDIKLYDALLNKTIELNKENTQVIVPGNNYNRYFLNLTDMDMNGKDRIMIYSPEKEKIVVTTSSSDKLQNIKIYSLSGTILKELNNLNVTETELSLPSGVYIICTQSSDSNKTQKICCR